MPLVVPAQEGCGTVSQESARPLQMCRQLCTAQLPNPEGLRTHAEKPRFVTAEGLRRMGRDSAPHKGRFVSLEDLCQLQKAMIDLSW